MYSISIIGGSDVVDSNHGRYLNHGSLRSCLDPAYFNSIYCVFETYLIDDMERTLALEPGQFMVLFVKDADRHSVIISFRLVPEVSMNSSGQDVVWVQSKVSELARQMSDSQPLLYSDYLGRIWPLEKYTSF